MCPSDVYYNHERGPGANVNISSEMFVEGTWSNLADMFFTVDQQLDSVDDPSECLFAFRLERDTLYINGRAVAADCRTFTRLDEVSLPVEVQLYSFDPPAASIDDPSVIAVLTAAGLRDDQVNLLRQNTPSGSSAVTAVSCVHGVIDSTVAGGTVSSYFDGYVTTESPGYVIFDQGEPLRLTSVLFDDSWTIGLATLCCEEVRGNVDGDAGDQIDIGDLVYLADYTFQGGPPPPCFDEADIDGDGDITVADLVFLAEYVFNNGPAPAPCP